MLSVPGGDRFDWGHGSGRRQRRVSRRPSSAACPRILHISRRISGCAIMKRKPTAPRNIGIDLNRRAIGTSVAPIRSSSATAAATRSCLASTSTATNWSAATPLRAVDAQVAAPLPLQLHGQPRLCGRGPRPRSQLQSEPADPARSGDPRCAGARSGPSRSEVRPGRLPPWACCPAGWAALLP